MKLLRKYSIKRLRLTEESYDKIHWQAIATSRVSHSISRRVRTTKMMFRWLPVGHNWRHHGALHSHCPCCKCDDETFSHLPRCPHKLLRRTRSVAYEAFLRLGLEHKIPEIILLAFIGLLKEFSTDSTHVYIVPPGYPEVHEAVTDQRAIGLENMSVGFLATSWQNALSVEGAKIAARDIVLVLQTLWSTLCDPVWTVRNHILHKCQNFVSDADHSELLNRLVWYRDNQLQALAIRHRFLIDHDVEHITRWSTTHMKQRLQSLDTARQIYALECKQRSRGQGVLTDYYEVYHTRAEETN